MKQQVELIFVPNYESDDIRKALPYLVVQEKLRVGSVGQFILRFPSGDKIFSLVTPKVKVKEVFRFGDKSPKYNGPDVDSIHCIFENLDSQIFGQELAKYCYRVLATPEQIGWSIRGYSNGSPLMFAINESEIDSIVSHGSFCTIDMEHPAPPERTNNIHLNAVLFDQWLEIKDDWIPKLIDNKVIIER